MYFTLDVVADALIFLCGVASIIYGYWRWSWYHENKERWWYVIGLLILVGVAWDFLTKSGVVALDYQEMFWSRNLLAAFIIVVCIAIYKRFSLE
jgi:hypothetical protein